MLKHRLSKFGNTTLSALVVLLFSGMLFSCQDALDDYSYDDGGEPSWLGESVYGFLRSNNSGHEYNYYADIVDDLGQTETFKKTGSKTVFVADDEAFERFFKDNKWGVTCYEDLTLSQKKILLKASMLDDAMLLDMLSATSANEKDEGLCLRRETSLTPVDSIPLVKGEETPKYNKYWDAYRGKERDAEMYIAMDASKSMMVHFLPEFLKKSGITVSDMSFFLRKNGEQVKTYKEGEAYIYDKKIVASDIPTDGFSDDTMTITCKNGYLYRLDDVLIPPSNMAAELRSREDTEVFSHIIERYSMPVFNAALTREFNSVTGKEDSVFSWSYYTQKDGGGLDITDPIIKDASLRPKSQSDVLLFNPGANQLALSGKMQEDMSAIFAPTDDAMLKYFTEEGGILVLEPYNVPGTDTYVEVTDEETLKLALNNIPDNIIAELINNLMQKSFNGTVPSRFDAVVDQASDPIEGIGDAVVESVVANNGVIYILNKVFGPATYSAVSAPATLKNNLLIMRNIITQLDYNSYLLAKRAIYTLFLPEDKSFVYYDPVSIAANEINKEKKPKAYQFFYDRNHPKNKDKDYLYAKTYVFDPVTYELTSDEDEIDYTEAFDIAASKSYFNAGSGEADYNQIKWFLYNRMSDLIEHLIVVDKIDKESTKKYYLTNNGGVIKVDNTGDGITFQGGEQVENGHHVAVTEDLKLDNGVSYITTPAEVTDFTHLYSSMPTPSTKSLYNQLMEVTVVKNEKGEIVEYLEDSPFYEFVKLVDPNVSIQNDMVKVLGILFPDANPSKVQSDSVKNYSTFFTSMTNGSADGKMRNIVPFFNGFNYTVYIPSAEALKEVINEGLPTWEDIWNCANGEGLDATLGAAPKKAVSNMRLLKEFIRYHFHAHSLFVDNVSSSDSYSTMSLCGGKIYKTLDVTLKNGSITITDERGNTANVLADDASMENNTWNLLCRDFEFQAKGGIPAGITRSSFSVAHIIDNTLKTNYLYGYDGRFKRFALNGELVDAMEVVGNTSNGLCEVDGKNCYLVARVDDSHGYLMIPRNGAFTKLTREDYYKEAGELVLIDNEGFRVNREVVVNSKTKKEEVVYSYYLDENENKLKYANNGDIIERVSTKEPSTEEDNNTEVVE